jgi:hypothetical protein
MALLSIVENSQKNLEPKKKKKTQKINRHDCQIFK